MAKSQGLANRLRAGTLSFCLLFLLVANNCIADYSVSIVLSDTNPVYEKVARSIVSSLGAGQEESIVYKTTLINTANKTDIESINQSHFIVAIGAQATHQALLGFPEKPVISSFVSLSALEKLQRTYPDKLLGAVVLDQPAPRLLQLTRLINPQLSSVGLLTGLQSNKRIPELTAAGQQLGIQLNTKQLEPTQNPVKTLEPIIAASQAYLVLPDKADFNRQTAKWIIYLSYRYRIPVIGYSSRYVDAGAMLSIYSTPEQIGAQTDELVKSWAAGATEIQKFQYPNHFVIRLNNKVKQSLGFSKLDAELLAQKLMAMEIEPYNLKQQDATQKSTE